MSISLLVVQVRITTLEKRLADATGAPAPSEPRVAPLPRLPAAVTTEAWSVALLSGRDHREEAISPALQATLLERTLGAPHALQTPGPALLLSWRLRLLMPQSPLASHPTPPL